MPASSRSRTVSSLRSTCAAMPAAGEVEAADAAYQRAIGLESQHFIDDENLRFEMRGDRKGQPDIHPRRVALHRRIEKPLDFGNGEFAGSLALTLTVE